MGRYKSPDSVLANRDTYLSALDWLGRAPSWFAPLLSIGGIAGGLAAWIISRRDRVRDVRRELDSEWFRVLVFGEIVPHLLKFLGDQRAAFAGISVDPKRRFVPNEYKNCEIAFKEAKNALQRRLLLLRVISVDKYDMAIGLIDEVDDAVTLHCAANRGFPVKGQGDFKDFARLDNQISKLSETLFAEIKDLHRSAEGRSASTRVFSLLRKYSWLVALLVFVGAICLWRLR